MRNRTPLLVWLFVAALAVIAGTVWEVQTEITSQPVTSNSGPSGTAGLAEVLRQSGFPVRVDRSARLSPKMGEVVVAIAPRLIDPMTAIREAFEEGQGLTSPDPEPSRLHRALAKAAEGGATVVYAEVPESLDDAYERVAVTRLDSTFPEKRAFQISFDPDQEDPDDSWVADTGPYDWYREAKVGWWVRVQVMGEGRAVLVADGLSATNRYLDSADNAEYWVTMLATLGGRENGVVFADALGGDEATPSLLGTLGPWAVAMQWQALFVFGLGVWWLGQRFGPLLPSADRDVTGRGTTHALAGVLSSGRQHGTAARIIANNRLVAIRRVQGLPPSSTPEQVLAAIPSEVARPMGKALALPDRAPAAVALPLIQELDEAIAATNVHRYRQ
ncbi:MAG: DUF4350 domain-containing protein [Fimbriimonadaceae bacterium]